jgi:polysaccharide pyruvyl transferase CsaB
MSLRARALISGYYGFRNTGDEAILAGLIQGFRQLALGVELTVLSADPRDTEAEHGVRAVPRSFGAALRLLRQSDLFISGGGGLIQDVTSWRSPLYYLGVIALARAAGLPTACIGHGIGPLRRAVTKRLSRRALSRVAVLAVRDHGSRDALQAIGVTRPIEVTADLAFLLPPPSAEDIADAWQRAGLAPDAGPAVAIALRRPTHATPHDFPASLAQSLTTACDQLGLRPVLLPMQHPQDLQFADRVAQDIAPRAEVVRVRLPARQMLALIGGSRLVVGMRLHALVFAAICGLPPVAVSYDPKVQHLSQELGLARPASIEAFDAPAFARAISDVWQTRAEVVQRLGQRLPGLRTAALRNIELVQLLLRRPG